MIRPPAVTVISHALENHILAESALIRVASIPAAHPYVRAIAHPQRVLVLPDPPVPGAPAEQWWPPVALTPEWLVAHADDYDVLHVHFGLESFTSGQLADALDAAHRCGRPVVYTVHDLENPQLVEQEAYRALLDVIVPGADHLVTLTATAAAEIERRWGRVAQVIPHPTLIEGELEPALDVEPRAERAIRVGIALRDLRPNIDAERAVRAAARAATLLTDAGVAVQVDVLMSERVRDQDDADRVVSAAAAHPSVHLTRTPHLTDAEIEGWLGALDLFVLPYRHGTHSGWVELCFDLGVPVAGTDVGHIAAQHPSDYSTIDLDDPQTLASAVQESGGHREQRAGIVAQRRRDRLAERASVRRAHADLYALALAGVPA